MYTIAPSQLKGRNRKRGANEKGRKRTPLIDLNGANVDLREKCSYLFVYLSIHLFIIQFIPHLFTLNRLVYERAFCTYT